MVSERKKTTVKLSTVSLVVKLVYIAKSPTNIKKTPLTKPEL